MEKLRRVAYWDNWKGLAIIAVVMIHASNTAFDFPVTSFNFLSGLGLRQLINYAVPIFLAFAGYFAQSAINETTFQYYKKRIFRIVVPYVIWTTIYLILKPPKNLDELIKSYFLGTGIGIGYFVIVLMQFIAITPFLLKINNIKMHGLIIVSLTFFGMAFSYHFRTQHQSHFFAGFPGGGILFLVWYPFYHLGLFLSRYKEFLKLERIKPRIIMAAIMAALVIAFLEGIYWSVQGNYRLGVSQIKISSFIVSILIFLLAVILADKKSWLSTYGILTWLGGNSFSIYLIHLIFLRVITKYHILEAIYEIQPLYIMAATFLSLVTSALLILAFRKTLSGRVARIILG